MIHLSRISFTLDRIKGNPHNALSSPFTSFCIQLVMTIQCILPLQTPLFLLMPLDHAGLVQHYIRLPNALFKVPETDAAIGFRLFDVLSGCTFHLWAEGKVLVYEGMLAYTVRVVYPEEGAHRVSNLECQKKCRLSDTLFLWMGSRIVTPSALADLHSARGRSWRTNSRLRPLCISFLR